jgi:hypothetical protein
MTATAEIFSCWLTDAAFCQSANGRDVDRCGRYGPAPHHIVVGTSPARARPGTGFVHIDRRTHTMMSSQRLHAPAFSSRHGYGGRRRRDRRSVVTARTSPQEVVP